MSRTLTEVEAALTSVRTAITAAEEAQEYATGLGNKKAMADLSVLYARENDLIAEREKLSSSGVSAGPIRNIGRIMR